MIDWTLLRELRTEIGPEDFDEVVDLFLEEVEEVVNRLRDAPDTERLENDLHFLKGSASNLGFRNLSRICQSGETNASQGKFGEIDINDLVDCYKTSKKTFMLDMQSQLTQCQDL